MPKPVIGRQRRTHPLIWLAAIICTIITTIVIISGIIVFIGYLAVRPKVPFVSVPYARLDTFDYDQAGVLNTRLSIIIKAENDNEKATASFYNFSYNLMFHDIKIAKLVNWPFDVARNKTRLFNYEVESDSIPLDPRQSTVVDASLKKGRVVFYLNGHTRTRWRVGPLHSVRFWLRLDCRLQFQWPGGISVDSKCTSKKK